jgi:hypothetical protein
LLESNRQRLIVVRARPVLRQTEEMPRYDPHRRQHGFALHPFAGDFVFDHRQPGVEILVLVLTATR